MDRRTMAGRWMAVALAACVGVASPAPAQTFREARKVGLPGSSDSAFPVQAVLADVGSPTGPADGILDVVAVQQNQGAALLYGRGDGSFSAGSNTDLGVIPTAMAAGDFDGDLLQDIVVTGTSKTLQWFRGTGIQATPLSEQGEPLVLDGTAVAAASGGLNGDGNMDVVVLNDDGAGGTVQVLLGHGDGSFEKFGEPFAAGVGVTAIVVADFTGDEIPDVAVASAVNNSVQILRNNGTGFLETPGTTVTVGLEPVGLVAGDLNQDGRMDLVSANRSSDSVSVILAASAGGFDAAADYASGGIGSYPSAVAIGDFDNDDKPDIFVANNRSFDIAILRGDGGGGFAGLSAYIADQDPVGVLAADLNGDGGADAVSLNFGDTQPNVAIILKRSDGKVVAIQSVTTEGSPVAIKNGDVDGDGRSDLIVTHDSTGPGAPGFVDVYRSLAGIGVPPVVHSLTVADPVAIAHGDVNGDGILDLLALNAAPSSLMLFAGKAAGGFEEVQSFGTGDGISALVVGDWNHDGRDDVAVSRVVPAVVPTSDPTGAVEIRLATESGFGEATSIDVAANAVAIASGDFDEDGRLDLVVASGTSAGSAILLGNGAGGFASVAATINNAQAVVVGDFDRDQHDDIAILSAGSDRKASAFYGDGSGAFPTRKDTVSFDGPSGLASRDVTGDGVPDLVVSDQGSKNSVWIARSSGDSGRRFSVKSYGVSRQPTAVSAGDLDGDGRYDIGAVTIFVASVAILSNDSTTFVVRGDGNNDTLVSAADTIALVRDVAEGGVRRAEDVGRGAFAGSPGLDANGDGAADRLDTLALVQRLFHEL